jgi:DNA-binding XRE family transcriptional regulator
MDLGITQKEAARRIGADPWTIINWEKGRTEPTVRFVPRIIRFLGQDPFLPGETFPDRIRAARRRLGLTQSELGDLVGLSKGTVYDLERGRQKPASPAGRKVSEALVLPS